MEINGKPWSPSAAACPNTAAPGQSPAQKLFMYRCKNPYPAATSSAFYYAASGQAFTRCTPQSQVMAGNVGVIQPVFGKTGAASLTPACQGSVQASAQAAPPSQTHQGPPLTMVTVSPDGKYLAGYSPSGNSVIVWVRRPGQAGEHDAAVGRHLDRLGSPGLPVGGRGQRHHGGRAGHQRQQARSDREQLPREDPRSRHRPGRRPDRRHRADRLGCELR